MRFAATVIGAGVFGIAGCTGGTTPPADGLATVTEVVDGDTIDVAFGDTLERIRLIGIDTPETKKPNSPVECYGPEASTFTESLLPPGTRVRVDRDVVGRDDYGRLLGYVYILHSDGTAALFVNDEIIRRGYATPLTIAPNNTFARHFAEAARAAEAADLGLWAACSP
ncbi:MAG: thermonuclease family protein [Ilumatobacteraceae bacterium]